MHPCTDRPADSMTRRHTRTPDAHPVTVLCGWGINLTCFTIKSQMKNSMHFRGAALGRCRFLKQILALMCVQPGG